MSDDFRVPGVTYTMPTAAEELRADEISARAFAPQLAMEYADALIEIAARNGPRSDVELDGGIWKSDWCPVTWEGGDGVHNFEASADDYCAAARALGIL